MQKLTLFVPDDIYNGLHRQVGKGKISYFVSDKVRPYLRPEKTGTVANFHGLLNKHATPVSPEAEERAKRAFMRKRFKARQNAT